MPKKPLVLTRKSFLKTAAKVAGAAVAALLIFPGTGFSKHPPLKIGYLPITDAAPLLVAHGLGYFAQEGLKVERPVMVRSWNVLSESFLAGRFNFTHMLFPIPVWMRFRQKAPIKVLAWAHTNGSAVTVRGNSHISSFAGLGGKQVAVPSWYSMHNLLMQMGLKAHGLTPVIRPQSASLTDQEVNLFILPPPDMPTALLAKKIDAFSVADPFNALSEEKFSAKIMRYSGDIWKNHPCCVIVTNEKLIKESSSTVQKAMNAIVRAQAWCMNNPEETAHLLSRDGERYLPVPHEILKRVFGPTPKKKLIHPEWDVKRIGFQPYPFPSATRFIVDQMKETLVEGSTSFLSDLDSEKAARELVDDRFVIRAIENNGGMKRFYKYEIENPFTREEILEIN